MTAEDSTAAMSSDSATGSSAKVPEGGRAPNEAALGWRLMEHGYSMGGRHRQRSTRLAAPVGRARADLARLRLLWARDPRDV